MKWTVHQQQAIEAPIGLILVNAGAGSGKTSVLAERVVRRLQTGSSLTDLLIITFTRKASLELKERLRHRLQELGVDDPAMLTQLGLIDSASISTIDGFVNQVVSQFGYLLQLPAKTSIIDQITLTQQKHRILDELIEQWFATRHEGFIRYVSDMTMRNDRRLRQQILDLDEIIRQYNDQTHWFTTLKERFYSDDFKASLKQAYEENLVEEVQKLREFLELLTREPALSSYESYIESLVDFFQPLFQCLTFDDVRAFFDGRRQPTLAKPKFIKSLDIDEDSLVYSLDEYLEEGVITSEQYDELKAYFYLKSYREFNLKPEIDKIKKLVEHPWEVLMQEYDAILPYQTTLVELTLAFRERVNQWFYQHGVMDYQTMANTALHLVNVFPEVQDELQHRFDEIFVDEYQDTSLFQDEFITAISNENLFCVGDIKQSIYRFRQADPTLFLAKQRMFAQHPKGVVIEMNENFRSNKPLIEHVNRLFGVLMKKELGGVDYDATQSLVSANPIFEHLDYPSHQPRGMVFVVPLLPEPEKPSTNEDLSWDETDEDYDDFEDDLYGDFAPAFFEDSMNSSAPKEEYYPTLETSMSFTVTWEADVLVAIQDIKEKMDHGFMIHDSGSLRPVRYDDFVILMDRRRYFKQMQILFDYHDVPAYFHFTESFVQTPDILAIKNLLRLVYSYTNQEYFINTFRHNYASVARSFLMDIEDDEIHVFLSQLKRQRTTSIEDVVLLAPEKSATFLRRVEAIADQSTTMSLYELIQGVFQQFDVFMRALRLYDTERVEKRLLFMLEKAQHFTDMGMQLRDFIEYFDFVSASHQQELDVELQETTEVQLGKVNIMTIHASKGLEFPIVYYPNLEMNFPIFRNKSVEYSHETGLISPGFDEGIVYPLSDQLYRKKVLQDDVSERLRLLYVALTRAKELAIVFIDSPEELSNLLTPPTKKKDRIINMASFFEEINIKATFDEIVYVALSGSLLDNYMVPKPQESTKNSLDRSKTIYRSRDLPSSIPFKPRTGSTQISTLLSKEELSAVGYGNHLHDLLSHLDFHQPFEAQLDRLKLPETDRNHLVRFASSSLISDIKGAQIYHEYRFHQPSEQGPINGIIDLLLVWPDRCRIIDFKLKSIDQAHYQEQVQLYLQYITNLLDRPTEGYLYSIITGDHVVVKPRSTNR